MPALQLLAQEFGVFFGEPVHDQRDQDGDRQRQRMYVVSDRGEDRRGDDRAVDTRSASRSGRCFLLDHR